MRQTLKFHSIDSCWYGRARPHSRNHSADKNGDLSILVKPLICNAQLSVRYPEVLTVAFEEIIAAEKRHEIRY